MFKALKVAAAGLLLSLLTGCYAGSSAYLGIGIGSVGLVAGWDTGIRIGYIADDGARTPNLLEIAQRDPQSARTLFVARKYEVSARVAGRIVRAVQSFSRKDFRLLAAYGLDDATLTAKVNAQGPSALVPFLQKHLGVSKQEAKRVMVELFDDAQGTSI